MGQALNDFDVVVHQHYVRPGCFYPMRHMLQRSLGMARTVAHISTGQGSILPHILLVNFCSRNVEFPVQARQQGLDPSAFLLE